MERSYAPTGPASDDDGDDDDSPVDKGRSWRKNLKLPGQVEV